MQPYLQEPQFRGSSVQLHAGVRGFMNGVYAWMAGGIAVTAAVAFGLSRDMNTMALLYGTPLKWLVLFGPLAMAWFLPARIPRMDRGGAIAVFALFAGLLGSGLAYIPLMFQSHPMVLVQALLVTVATFVGMAIFGFVTKKDLSGMGQFLVMAIIGAVVASLVNMFIGSEGLSLGVSMIVAVAAAGLTAYDTQAIKQLYLTNGSHGNLAILGALLLYVNFINLFLSLLRLFSAGGRD